MKKTRIFVATCATLLQSAIASAQSIAPPNGAANRFTLAAIGVQIYSCKAAASDATPTWAFVAPEADLFDQAMKRVGKHYAGPHWEFDDGSKIVGKVEGRENSTRVGAIPHLLISTQNVGKAGGFSTITHLQRVNTVGGVAPDAASCTRDANGKEARVYYTADYVYYSAATR
jgi:hypothetical protein